MHIVRNFKTRKIRQNQTTYCIGKPTQVSNPVKRTVKTIKNKGQVWAMGWEKYMRNYKIKKMFSILLWIVRTRWSLYNWL